MGTRIWEGRGDRVDGLWKINKSYPLVITKVRLTPEARGRDVWEGSGDRLDGRSTRVTQ